MESKYYIKILLKNYFIGWLIFFKYLIFVILTSFILSPLYFFYDEIRHHHSFIENTAYILFILVLFPYAFFISSKITGFFLESNKKNSIIKITEPETGIVTEYEDNSNTKQSK